MKIGPDGSLTLITSSAEDNNIMVRKIQDTELKVERGPLYEIFTISAKKIQHESSSDKSDEEEDKQISNIKLRIHNIKLNAVQNEKKEYNSKDNRSDINIMNKKQSPKKNEIPRKSEFQHFRGRERFSRTHDRSRSDIHNSSGNRYYNAFSNSKNNYRNPSCSASAANIDPWLSSPQMINLQMPMIHNYFHGLEQHRPSKPALEQMMLTEPALDPFMPSDPALNSFRSSEPSSESFIRSYDNSNKSCGLLGYSPASHFPPQFQQMNQEVNPSSFWNDEKVVGENNCWGDDYANNYRMSVPSERPLLIKQNLMMTRRSVPLERLAPMENKLMMSHMAIPSERTVPVEQNRMMAHRSVSSEIPVSMEHNNIMTRRPVPSERPVSMEQNRMMTHRSVSSERPIPIEQNRRRNHRSVPSERSVPVEQNHMMTYEDNRSYRPWKNRNRWRKNRSKKWRGRKATSATSKDGYRPWAKQSKSSR